MAFPKPSLWLSEQMCLVFITFLFICQCAFADPDTGCVLKMKFLGSWKSQMVEVIISQRAVIDCNYLVINMLGALEERGHYMNMYITPHQAYCKRVLSRVECTCL